MKKHEDEKLLDHNYDGIQEFDNPLPRWWLATFYGAIVYAVLYLGYYHLGGPGKDPRVDLAQELSEIKDKQNASVKNAPGPDEAALMAALQDPARKTAGKSLFGEKCASCHVIDGGGSIGPNLTDKYWIHGDGSLTSILQVVSEGVADKGMPPWKALMKPDEIISVVAYVKTFQGTKPANPKAPQGNEVKQ